MLTLLECVVLLSNYILALSFPHLSYVIFSQESWDLHIDSKSSVTDNLVSEEK